MPFPPTTEAKERWRAAGGLNLTTNVPMLVHEGVAYTQSSAVLRFAGRLGNLYPVDDPAAAYAVDNMIAAVDDYRSAAYEVVFAMLAGGPPPEKLEQHKAAMDKHFANFERLLGDNDFFCGDAITVADLTAFDIFNNFSFNLMPSQKAKFPKLVAFMERILARPNISAYMASEKFTGLFAFPSTE